MIELTYNFLFEYSVIFLRLISIFILLSCFGVVVVRNPVYSILFLIIVFALTSFLFILFGCDFLAMTLIIVYLGAVCVLFLFVVMMLNIKLIELKRSINFIPFLFVLFSLISIITVEQGGFFLDLMPPFFFFDNNSMFFFFSAIVNELPYKSFHYNTLLLDQMKVLGLVLYDFFFIQFVLASLVLLVAMLGSIFLTLEVSSNSKKVESYRQLVRSKALW